MSDQLSVQEEIGTNPSRKGGKFVVSASSFVDVILPGLLLCLAVATVAVGVQRFDRLAGFSPLILAIVLGMVFRNALGLPSWAAAGVAFAMRPLLRIAIALLGLQLGFQHLMLIGVSGAAIIVGLAASTFLFTVWFGRLIGCDRALSQLLAAGTSICGASAVVAANTVVRARDEDVAYAVACVTLFGTIAMFLFPFIASVVGLDAWTYGFWVGASVHEVAQVVAAAFQLGPDAGEAGTIVKLARVMLLAPLILALGLSAQTTRTAERRAAPVPWFIVGFMALLVLNSVVEIPADLKLGVAEVTAFMMAVALAAVGLAVDIGKLRTRGLKPMAVGLASFVFVGAGGFFLVTALG